MTPTRLADLPQELLVQICGHLCWHCCRIERAERGRNTQPSIQRSESRAALLSLARTCRALNPAAESVLYHWFCVQQDADLVLLLRSLAGSPDMGRKVLDIEVRYSATYWTSRKVTSYAKLMLQLLVRTPNLARLRLQLPSTYQGIHTGQVRGVLLSLETVMADLMAAASPMPALASLKRLDLTGLGSFDIVLHRAAALAIRMAPHITSLHIIGCGKATEGFASFLGCDGGDANPSNAPLQDLVELHLTHKRASPSCLQRLLRVVGPNLARVSIEPASKWPSSPAAFSNTLDFLAVLESLQPWRESLQKLSTVIFCTRVFGQWPRNDLRALLCTFTGLETLHCHSMNFNDCSAPDDLTSSLPQSIRTVVLHGSIDPSPAFQGLLAEVTAGHFSRLKKVVMCSHYSELQPPLSRWLEQLRAAFEVSGVRFSLLDEPCASGNSSEDGYGSDLDE